MTRTIITIAALAVSVTVANNVDAQFISQTHAIPGDTNYSMYDSKGRRGVGAPTAPSYIDRYSTINTPELRRAGSTGNMGLPMQDRIPQQANTNFSYKNYNYQMNPYQAQQLQQSIQNFARAVQQVRQQRMQNYNYGGYNYGGYNNGYRNYNNYNNYYRRW